MTYPRQMAPIRFSSLDGIRGYAAIAVVIYHCMLSLDPKILYRLNSLSIYQVDNIKDLISKILIAVFNGDAAVVLFFILSGFVLSYKLRHDFSEKTPVPVLVGFFIKRFFRLYPPLVLSVLGMIFVLLFVFYYFSIPMSGFYFSYAAFWRNVLLISPDVNGPTWTIIVEIIIVPFIGFVVWADRRTAVVATIGFIAFALVCRYIQIIPIGFGFNTYMVCFALGLLLSTPFGFNLSRRLSRIGPLPFLVGFIGIELFVSYSLLQIVFGYLFISSVIFNEGRVSDFLKNPASLHFGKNSYGIYLWHYPFVVASYTPFALYFPQALGEHAIFYGLATFPIVFAITFLLSEISERFVEAPFIRLGHRVARTLATAKPSTS